MNIALYDGDFIPNQKHIFNLDLMQLAAYYKKNRNIVNLIQSEEKIPFFSKVFYIQDYYTPHFPDFIQEPNVEYFGRAFSTEIYVPFADDIRYIAPDMNLYKPPTIPKTSEIYDLYSYNRKATHLRLADIPNFTPLNLTKYYEIPPNTSLVLHDYNIVTVPHYQELLQSIYLPKYSILPKYPILINSFSDLSFLSQFRFSSLDTTIIYLPSISVAELTQLVPTTTRAFFDLVHFKIMDKSTQLEEFPAILHDTLNKTLFLKHIGYPHLIYVKSAPAQWYPIFKLLNYYGQYAGKDSFIHFCFDRSKLSDYLKIEAMLKEYNLFDLASRRADDKLRN